MKGTEVQAPPLPDTIRLKCRNIWIENIFACIGRTQ